MNMKTWFKKIQSEFQKTKQSGFTLIELMVSLTLFVFVVLAAVSSLYAVNEAYRKVSAMRSVLDNLNFAMESMSRTIRTSTNITCNGALNPTGYSKNCPFPSGLGNRISMNSLVYGYEVEFRYNTTEKRLEKRVRESSTWSDWLAITAPEIEIQSFNVFVQGSDSTQNIQPSVILLVRGVATAYTGETTTFALHTLISQRSGK